MINSLHQPREHQGFFFFKLAQTKTAFLLQVLIKIPTALPVKKTPKKQKTSLQTIKRHVCEVFNVRKGTATTT